MRALGALTVILGCGLFGLVRAMGLAKQAQCVAAVIDSLRYMASSLKASSPPLPELILELSENSKTEVREFYGKLCAATELLGDESFENMWTSAVMTDKTLLLSRESRRQLCKAGAYIGRFSVEEQTAALESCIVRLEAEYRLASEKAREGKRLYPGLGLTAGIMLAAVFI